MRLLIVGCGYVGIHVARHYCQRFADQAAEVYALTRTAERGHELQAEGIRPIVGDWLDPPSLAQLRAEFTTQTQVLVCVPQRPVGEHASQTHARGL